MNQFDECRLPPPTVLPASVPLWARDELASGPLTAWVARGHQVRLGAAGRTWIDPTTVEFLLHGASVLADRVGEHADLVSVYSPSWAIRAVEELDNLHALSVALSAGGLPGGAFATVSGAAQRLLEIDDLHAALVEVPREDLHLERWKALALDIEAHWIRWIRWAVMAQGQRD